jgi:NADH-quinone oxidoreductase subunit E
MKPETNVEIKPETKPELDFIEAVVKRYAGEEGMLIPMLQDIQAEYGYLPADHLRSLSKMLKVPLSRIYGVATFYASFRLSPKGQHDVTLCMGTVCYLKGSARISEVICAEYGVEPGGTTPDRLFTLNLVNCVGACALAPVMIVDGKYHDAMTPESALKILRGLSSEEREAEVAEGAKTGGGSTTEGAKASKQPKAREPAAPEREKPSEQAKTREPQAASVPAKPKERASVETAEEEAPAPAGSVPGAVTREGVKPRGKTAVKSASDKAVKTPVKASGKKPASRQASKPSSKKKAGRK